MASPFRFFRKHTKVFMAVAAVLCMFIFVIGGALSGGGPSGDEAQTAREPVATWDGGSLNQGELASLVQRRLLTDEFLQRLFVQGGGKTEYDTTVPLFFAQTQNRTRSQVEQQVIMTEVAASMARQAGLTVSDDLINHYLEEVGSKNVDGAGVAGILKNMGQGNARANEAVVFETLRKILLGYFYRSAYSDASQTVLPHERWEDWLRVNEHIALQAAVLPVASFVPQVPEPTDAQLKALYEEFKSEVPGQVYSIGNRQFPSPNPGFAEPRRVRLQYVLGSLQARTDAWLDKVTEEEIAEYYERNKRLEFIKMSLPGEDDSEDDEPKADPAATDSSEPATPASDEPADGETPATSETEPAATPEEPAAAPSEAAPPAEAAPAEAAPAEASPAESPPEAEPPAAETEGETTSSLRRPSPFRLTAFQTPPADDAGEAPAPDESPAEEAPAETPSAEAAPADAPPAEEAPAETAPSETAADAPPAEAPANDDAAAEDEKVEYEPLEKVRDEIRRTIAAEKAADELDGIMARASAQLQTEFNRYTVKRAEAVTREKPAPKPPAKLTDLQWLADEYGLTAERTALLAGQELLDTAVGKAIDNATGARIVTQAAFTTLKLYEPMLAKTRDGDWYLVMKIEDVPQRTPPFDEVEAKVVAAWKHREAAKLAEKKAQELAAEVAKSSADFGEFFTGKGYEVINETSLFSWLEYPAGAMGSGNPPGLGDIPELSGVGPDLLRAAFELQDGKTAGLLNFDKSTAYVIRVARRQYTQDELRELFLEEANIWPGRRDMLMSHISTFNSAMLKDLSDRAGLEFDEAWEKQQAERAQQVD